MAEAPTVGAGAGAGAESPLTPARHVSKTAPPPEYQPRYIVVRNLQVQAIDKDGAPTKTRTRNDVLAPLLKPLLDADTPAALDAGAIESVQRMQSTGVYDLVSFSDARVVQQPGMPGGGGSRESPAVVDTTILVKERNFASTIGGDIGRAPDNRPEARARFSMQVHNQMGLAETIEGSMHRNQHGSDVYSASTSFPTLFGTMRSLKLEAFSDQVNFMARSAFIQQDRGLRATLGQWRSPHTFSYTGQWRDLLPSLRAAGGLDSGASNEVLRQTAPSFKSALSWNFAKDKRHCFGGPVSGGSASTTVEWAGAGGDVKHLRATASGQYNWSWMRTLQEDEASAGRSPSGGKGWLADWKSSGVTLSVASSVGTLLPYGQSKLGGPPVSSVLDRFFLGGTHSLRGFAHAGVGPRAPITRSSTVGSDGQARGDGAGSEFGDALGGDAMWTASARLLLPPPLPWKLLTNIGARSQIFAVAGNVLTSAKTSPAAALTGARATVGVGFCLPIPLPGAGAANIEINYPIWRRAASQDVTVSVGLGVSF